MPVKKAAPVLGDSFEKLTVVAYVPRRFPDLEDRVHCFCSCGGECLVRYGHWRLQKRKDCGCARGTWSTIHGHSKKAQYQRWRGIISRCTNPKDQGWKNYGGRGIKMAERWKDFESFANDIGEMPSPKHSLDRINNDGNYEPGNVRWALSLQQMSNRRGTVNITYKGVTKSRTQWARHYGIPPGTLLRRLRRNPDLEECVKPLVKNEISACGSRRGALLYEHQGQQKTITEWSKALEIKASTLNYRIKRGIPLSRVFVGKISRSTENRVRIYNQTKNIVEWAKFLGVSRNTIYSRLGDVAALRALYRKKTTPP